MLERFGGVDTLRGVVNEHLLQEVDAVGVELGDHLREVLGLPLGELVPVTKAGDAGPDILRGRAEQLEDVQELLQLGVAGEQRLLPRQLGEDAPDAPDVDGGGVVGASEENLGGAVPQRHNLVRVRLHRHGEGATETEIRHLDDVIRLFHQKVLGLEVAMHHAVAVQVRTPEAQLVHEILHHVLRQGFAGPRPVRSMKFFRSWSRYSNTR